MTYNDSQKAFERAIASRRLTAEDKYNGVWPYAGDYMYMGTDENGRDMFKHVSTRKYLSP